MFEKSGNNLGSICKLEVVKCTDIASMPIAYKGRLLGEIVLEEGAEWENVYFTPGSGHFAEQREGNQFKAVVKFAHPKDTPANLAASIRLEKSLWVAKITGHNGNVIYIGTKSEGVGILLDIRDYGGNKRDNNHSTHTISRTHMERVSHAAV